MEEKKNPRQTYNAAFLPSDCYYPAFVLPPSTPHPELVTPALSPPGSSPVSWLMIIPMGSHLKCHWSDNNSFAHNFTRPSVPWQAFMGYIFVGPETHCPAILGEHAKAFRPGKKNGTGPHPVSQISGLASTINSGDQCFSSLPHHTFGRQRKATVEKRKKRKKSKWVSWCRRRLHFNLLLTEQLCSDFFLLSCRYHSTWGTNTVLDSRGDVFQISPAAEWHILTAWGSLVIGATRHRKEAHISYKSTRDITSINPMCLQLDGYCPNACTGLCRWESCGLFFQVLSHNCTHLLLLQVILILTKLFDFNLGAVTESSLWR